MKVTTLLTQMFNLRMPVIMAPMFLVSNEAMMQASIRNGILGCFPSLNYRNENELEDLCLRLNAYRSTINNPGQYGVNLIVQQTNPLYRKHLSICRRASVPFYITSLGNPLEVIETAHSYGAKVFCDVTNLIHAAKCAKAGCDGFIAVASGAGGHAGPYAQSVLIPALREEFSDLPVIAAGGVANGDTLLSVLAAGAAGASIGTRFIASNEASVSMAYKQAVVDAGMEDIVLTERLSGTPCAVINTPFVKRIGTHQNWFERILNKNPSTKKYFKMLVQLRGMKQLENAVKPGNYNNLWSAGQSAQLVHDILSCDALITGLERELIEAMQKLQTQFTPGNS